MSPTVVRSSSSPELIRPDIESRCKWQVGVHTGDSPHGTIKGLERSPEVLPHILEAIGKTPMVQLNHIPKAHGLRCQMYAKCEFLNPGGSIKDRIAYRMVQEAEKSGHLKPGDCIIEPTSGNTGIGLAMAAAVKGYRCIIVMPEKMSNEKVDTLRILGAEIVRTPTLASFDSPEGLISVSQRLNREIPNSFILDQYRNPGNPLAHYDQTAEEILEQCQGKVDVIVCTAGTGGTITGIGRKIKEKCPDCRIIGVDPVGSILAEPESLNACESSFYEVEGIGYDFIPTVLDRSVVDMWIKTNDKESFLMSRRLIKEEGLLCGGSSGSAMIAALKVCSNLNENQRCVVLLPDGIRNYMTKFVNDRWMAARDFIIDDRMPSEQLWWWDVQVSCLNLKSPLTISPKVSCQEAIDIMKKEGFDQLPVVNETGSIEGMVTLGNLLAKVVHRLMERNDPVDKVLYRQFRKVRLDTPLGRVSRMLDKDHFVLVVHSQRLYSSNEEMTNREVIIGIVTQIDLVHFITNKEKHVDNTITI